MCAHYKLSYNTLQVNNYFIIVFFITTHAAPLTAACHISSISSAKLVNAVGVCCLLSYVSPARPQNDVTVLLHIFACHQVLSLPLPFRPFSHFAHSALLWWHGGMVACGFASLVCAVVIMPCYYCYYYDYVAVEYVLLGLFYCCFVLNCHF